MFIRTLSGLFCQDADPLTFVAADPLGTYIEISCGSKSGFLFSFPFFLLCGGFLAIASCLRTDGF